MKRTLTITLLCAATSGVLAQQGDGGTGLAITRPETQARGTLTVTSTSFASGALMDRRYSAYGDNLSPALSWSAVPGARSYALIAQDPDARRPIPVLHWLAWNIPARVSSLPEGLPTLPRLSNPSGVLQGTNTHGSIGYSGPNPPVGDAPHHYHFQLYALDNSPEVAPGASLDQLLAAMKGHVLAKGALVGRYAQPRQAQK
jgi:Raf kinase inhibitor-like YbhB/YbcL family protein